MDKEKSQRASDNLEHREDSIRLAVKLRSKELARDVVISRLVQTPRLSLKDAIQEAWDLVESVDCGE